MESSKRYLGIIAVVAMPAVSDGQPPRTVRAATNRLCGAVFMSGHAKEDLGLTIGPDYLDVFLQKAAAIVQSELDRLAAMTPQEIREEMIRHDVTGDIGDPEGTPLVRRLGEVATQRCQFPEDWYVSVSKRGNTYRVSIAGLKKPVPNGPVQLEIPESAQAFEKSFKGYGYPDLLDRLDM
jgi:hypothetical protein